MNETGEGPEKARNAPLRAVQGDSVLPALYRAPKCLGLFGWMFGHKYLKSRGGYTNTSTTCWRCGTPIGTLIPVHAKDDDFLWWLSAAVVGVLLALTIYGVLVLAT